MSFGNSLSLLPGTEARRMEIFFLENFPWRKVNDEKKKLSARQHRGYFFSFFMKK